MTSADKVRDMMAKIRALEAEVKKLDTRVAALEAPQTETPEGSKKKKGIFGRGK